MLTMCASHLADDAGRGVDLGHRQPHTRDRPLHSEQPLRITQISECEPAVELVHADAIDAGNRKAFCAWHHASRRHHAVSQGDRHFVADTGLQFLGQLNAEHNIELASHQFVQRTLLHDATYTRYRLFEIRLDSA